MCRDWSDYSESLQDCAAPMMHASANSMRLGQSQCPGTTARACWSTGFAHLGEKYYEAPMRVPTHRNRTTAQRTLGTSKKDWALKWLSRHARIPRWTTPLVEALDHSHEFSDVEGHGSRIVIRS
ncbi:hypothetical protein LMH87_010388 [Akanthomyces muscarius]|uniref:Uncharacterized protein n=1 Tax=Akanthomyces muscarius TaxID=2231603 RepID=A0A9W8QEV2_AKAMU|nr:hypothetical protein LMH87_010388 [Akanthomyces muscarius]KAJ4153922.1 hypothetical protein LMH87_010388 [Akanthomyces muscarius]